MAEELHPLTTLLLARMKSHPDEFMVGIGRDHVAENDRWGPALASVYRHGSEADKAALKAEVDVLRMAEAHEWTMDELCNGDERRRKEQEELEYERNLLNRVNNQKLAMQQQQTLGYTDQLRNALQSTKESMAANILGKAFK